MTLSSLSRRLILLSTLLMTTHTLAQANPPGNQPVGNNPAPAPTSAAPPPDSSAPPGSSAPPPSSAAPTNPPPSSTGASSNPPSTSGTSGASGSSSAPPTLTSATFAASNTDSSSATAPPLPTLSNVLPPPLVVPDTSNAPFMQHSTLPEGTVFICVGAALGFLGLCVLAWRGLVAWSLHRSVKRAAETAYAPDSKSVFGWGSAPAGSTGGYKSMYTDSNLSMEQLGNARPGGEVHGGRSKEEKRGSHMSAKRASRAPPANSSALFFSPTATSGNQGNRSSGYLPAGYYAPGSSTANSGNPVAHLGGPTAAGYGRVQSRDGMTPSPPDSPSLRAQSRPTSTQHLRPNSAGNRHSSRLSRGDRLSVDNTGGGGHRRSKLGTSGDFSVNAPNMGRAPSMYLEDLFENHGHGPGERF